MILRYRRSGFGPYTGTKLEPTLMAWIPAPNPLFKISYIRLASYYGKVD